jgi:isopropylmalate/homocitrate/citramalate synthase
MNPDRISIFDTTLRDGEQSSGASMTKDEKLRIARALEKLKLDVIEAGFAAVKRARNLCSDVEFSCEDVLGVHTNIVIENILSTSRLVSSITGFAVQQNKAIVAANAFAHESGIHQDGVLKHRETDEIMSAQSVGWHTNRLSLGKLSGRNEFRSRLQKLGIDLKSEAELNLAFARFKELADKKQDIFDEDLQALVSATLTKVVEHTKLVCLDKAGRIVNGADTDIVVASAKAYLNALNLMREGAYRAHPQAADI